MHKNGPDMVFHFKSKQEPFLPCLVNSEWINFKQTKHSINGSQNTGNLDPPLLPANSLQTLLNSALHQPSKTCHLPGLPWRRLRHEEVD